MTSPAGSENRVRVAVVGASGYTGAELVRLLVGHPGVELKALTADRRAGQALADVFPHLAIAEAEQGLPPLSSVDGVDASGIDVAFLCLPHGAAHGVAGRLPENVRIIDLSPDFRFADPALYGEWYGSAHAAPALQDGAVYGLTELNRDALSRAPRIISCPGCYPTASLLALVPLVAAGVIDADDVIIDAKSGVSGAGRAANEASLFTEVSGGVHAYGIAGHRHVPEIEQALSKAAGRAVRVNFTPHLMPMNRGILASIYVRLADGMTVDDARDAIRRQYRDEPFVRLLDAGRVPATRHVRGSNHCLIGVFADRVAGRAIVMSVIDNLVKGASGQAIQNMNVVCGMPETEGLAQPPLFP